MKFLVIDDDSDDRELFQEALTSLEATIVCYFAEEAEEALQRLEKQEIISPNLIFLDINLPGMSGWQFLTTLKKDARFRDIPVIMYSTSSHQRDKEIASDLGAVCFITKPSNFKSLREILSVIVEYSEIGNYSDLYKTLGNPN